MFKKKLPPKKSSDAIERYLNDLDLNSDFLFSEEKFKYSVDEISTYLELVYGEEEKLKFLRQIEDNDPERRGSIGRMKAYLLSLQSRNVSTQINKTSPQKQTSKKSLSDSVFIVHGHDNEAKETVARFITKLGLKPVILHERPSDGKTIIEKLESNAEDVSFAIVLLTPDDQGAPFGSSEYKHRARQNVIYELGFFNAKLGRDRVCVLKKGDIEVLSDYLGVVYVEMDKSNGWKNQLARELRSAGMSIDSNDLAEALLS